MILFYGYPKCSTCIKAYKELENRKLQVTYIHIKDTPPTKDTLRKLYEKSHQPIKKFLNTSGVRYRELGLAKKIPNMSDEEILELLSSDGMLIKRPILELPKEVVIGYPKNGYQDIEG